ncbi:putative quorum-sensing-regulated virulence factor [Aliarcobacter butzleri]
MIILIYLFVVYFFVYFVKNKPEKQVTYRKFDNKEISEILNNLDNSDRKLQELDKTLNSFKNIKKYKNINKNNDEKYIKFGKYKGMAWTNIPKDYLIWLANNVDGNGKYKAIEELGRRKYER